jgi:hypothetical protein
MIEKSGMFRSNPNPPQIPIHPQLLVIGRKTLLKGGQLSALDPTFSDKN